MLLLQFVEVAGGNPVFINPGHIVAVRPVSEHETAIYLDVPIPGTPSTGGPFPGTPPGPYVITVANSLSVNISLLRNNGGTAPVDHPP